MNPCCSEERNAYKKKVFCVCCRYAQRHDLLTFSNKGEQACTLNNYKKTMGKICAHEKSDMHLESKLKWYAGTAQPLRLVQLWPYHILK